MFRDLGNKDEPVMMQLLIEVLHPDLTDLKGCLD